MPAPTGSTDADAEVAAAAEEKARRASRTAAHDAAPPPERDVARLGQSPADLHATRTELGAAQDPACSWRRVIQARLDHVPGPSPTGDPGADLARVLTDTRSRVHRLAPIDV